VVAAHYSNGVLLLSDQTCFLSYFPSFPQVVAAPYSKGEPLLAEPDAGESRTRLFMLSRCGGKGWFIQAAGCTLLANRMFGEQGGEATQSCACVRACVHICPLRPHSQPCIPTVLQKTLFTLILPNCRDLTIPPVGTATGAHVAVAGLREAVSQLEVPTPGEACAIR